MKQQKTIVLASASPRRKEMLARHGVVAAVHPADIDESAMPGETPSEYVKRLAFEKAMSVATAQSNSGQRPFVLAADTAVVLGDEILGKPTDSDDAARMLQRLSGKHHWVLTGWALGQHNGAWHVDCCSTAISFFALTREQVADYVATQEPLDKAGAYGIQGQGALLVEKVDGDYSNVVGLPIARVMRQLVVMGAIEDIFK